MVHVTYTGFDHSGGGFPQTLEKRWKNIDLHLCIFSDDLKQKAPLRKGNHAQKKLPSYIL